MALLSSPPAGLAASLGPSSACLGAHSITLSRRQQAWGPPHLDAGALLSAPDGASRLASAVASSAGVLVLDNALHAPFGAIGELFGRVTPEAGARANAAYCSGTSRLVWKDAHGEGRGGPHVDEKRVIDLSPHRMETLASADPALAAELGEPLQEAVAFFTAAKEAYGPLLTAALSEATGYPFAEAEARYAFRMVDYGARDVKAGEAAPLRCSAHRDFGPATLIWPGGEESQGLEVRLGGEWRRLPPLGPGCAVLLFGLCTAWRSNGRIPAVEHRVSDAPSAAGGQLPAVGGRASPRRLSAVLFVGLCDAAELSPALASPSEAPRYRAARVGDVGPTVRRKWSWREGSVTAEEAAAEAEERSRFATQEELIAALFKL